MQIRLLGPLEVRDRTGAAVPVGGRRARTLLALLALHAGQVVSRDRLIDAIWGDQPPPNAPNALQALVSRLRRALPEGAVESRPAGYRMAVEPDAVDIRRFERLVSAGRTALADRPEDALATLGEALALWRGAALASGGTLTDLAGASFASAEVARLDELRLAATEDRAEAALRLGDGRTVVPELESVLTAYPTRERAAGLLMRALVGAGRGGDALTTYQRIRTALAERLGTDPSPDLAALHQAVLRGDPALLPPPPGATAEEPPCHNLRHELTSFVGREEELARVRELVSGSRLTTLTGPGGSGKTRLAVESARSLLSRSPEGVWLVELAPLTDPAEVPRAVLAALGQRGGVGLPGARSRQPSPEPWSARLDALEQHLATTADDPVDRLTEAVADRRLLLVLDNCEHLVDAVARLADRLLRQCPRLRILTTSREPLGITGEVRWQVEPLRLPPADADAPLARSYPAVQLLADRAAAARPGFTVDAATAPDVIRICRALDGLPLAIELAAARLRTMTPAQLAERLQDRFRLLTNGSRTALPRHQTLWAVVDWSWDLLDEAERALLRRLAFFTGGATVPAAEQVCASDNLPADRVLALLTALTEKSLLVAGGTGQPRYHLLETIRAYALARLAEAGEVETVRRAHVSHFLKLAETAEPHLRTGEQVRWLARLREDHGNLHAAVRGAVTAGDGPTAVRLVGALGWFWWLGGHKWEGAELAAAALALPVSGEDAEPRALAYALAALNMVDGPQDEAQAVEWFDTAAGLAKGTRQRHPLVRAVGPLNELFRAETLGGAWAPPQPDLGPLLDDPDDWLRATARVMNAHVTLNSGRGHAQAEEDFRTGLAEFRRTGDRWGISFALTALAELVAWRGEFATAVSHLEEAVGLLAELGGPDDLVLVRLRLVYQLWLIGDQERAEAELARARREADRAGTHWGHAAGELAASELARLSGDLPAAADRIATAAARIAAGPASPHLRAWLAGSEGLVSLATGDLATARGQHAEAVRLAIASQDAPIVARSLVGAAAQALAEGNPDLAAELLGASVAIRGAEDRSLLDADRVAAAARAALGEPASAAASARGREATVETVASRLSQREVTPSA